MLHNLLNYVARASSKPQYVLVLGFSVEPSQYDMKNRV